MAWKTLDDMDIQGKVVLTRVDINVPMEDGEVTDSTRIDRIVPTVRDILARGGKPVLLAHFGRPKGQVRPEMSLAQVRPALETALGATVQFAEDCIGLPAKRAVAELLHGEVLLLENTRFHPRSRTMTRVSPLLWRLWAMFSAMTRFPLHIGRMHQQPALHGFCLPARGG